MGNLSTVIGQSIAHYTNERTGHGTGPRCTGFPFHPGEHRMAEGLGLRLELPQVGAAQTEPSDQHENTYDVQCRNFLNGKWRRRLG